MRSRTEVSIYAVTTTPVFNQQGDAIGALRRLGWKRQIAKSPRRFANLERWRRVRNDASNRRVAVEDGQCPTVSHRSQIFAEARLEVGNADVALDHL
jgi:hypothetical protein